MPKAEMKELLSDYDAMAATLDATDQYRVLRRLVSRSIIEPYDGSVTRLGLFVDVETTGLDPSRDEIVELAMVPFTYGVDGRIFNVHQAFEKLREPSQLLSTKITALRAALIAGKSAEEAARIAKQAASFEGDMRDIAAQLMNRFDLHKLFRLADVAELFGAASHRAHYTSLLRYPVLHWQTKVKKDKTKTTGWFDYSGGDSAFTTDMLLRSIAEDFEPEIASFKDAWLVPFGPVPAVALEKMADRGLVDPDRILPGVNHPSGTQWNRHNCQLNTSDDHSRCAKNVGCETIRGRSKRLEEIVASRLASPLA